MQLNGLVCADFLSDCLVKFICGAHAVILRVSGLSAELAGNFSNTLIEYKNKKFHKHK